MDNKGTELFVGSRYYSRLSKDECGFWANKTKYDGVMLVVKAEVDTDTGIMMYFGEIVSGLKAYGRPGDEICFGDQSPLHLALTPCDEDKIIDINLFLDDIFDGGL